jgi:hypothetical protein
MQFLQPSWRTLIDYFHKRPHPEQGKPLDPYEPISRYIFSKSNFSSQNQIVKPGAFLPNNLQVSVFRTYELTDSESWDLADKEIVQKQSPPKTLYGCAETTPKIIDDVDLDLVIDNNPHRHGNIAAWPIEKHEQKMKAAELASKSKLKLVNII